jgi:hypothetical protein
VSNAADDSPAIPRRGPNLAFWIIGAFAAVLTLVGFGAQFLGGSDSQAVTIEGDGNTVVGPAAEVETPAGASAGTGAAGPSETDSADATSAEPAPTTEPEDLPSSATEAQGPPSTDGANSQSAVAPASESDVVASRTSDEQASVCVALNPVSSPSNGRVDAGADGCPVLASQLVVPFGVHRWVVRLDEGQEISFNFFTNGRLPLMGIEDPQGVRVLAVPDVKSAIEKFVAEEAGEYVFFLENDDSSSYSYTLALYNL